MELITQYSNFYDLKLEKFLMIVLPECLEKIAQRGWHLDLSDTSGFPRHLLENIRDDQEFSRETKIELATVVIGLWNVELAKATWVVGPYEADRLTESVCIGIETADGESFSPITPLAAEIIDEDPANPDKLGITANFAEFDRRKAEKRSS